jgi:phosphoribosylglycinamide formyltransferase-1
VLEGDTEEALGARVLKEEHRIYPLTLRLLASGALEVRGNRVLGAG